MNDSFSPVEKLRMTKSNVTWSFSAGENLRGSNGSNSNLLSGTDVNAYLKKVRINWEANYRLANPFSYRIDGAMTKLFPLHLDYSGYSDCRLYGTCRNWLPPFQLFGFRFLYSTFGIS